MEIVAAALQVADFNAMFLDTASIFVRHILEFSKATGYRLKVSGYLSDAEKSSFWISTLQVLFGSEPAGAASLNAVAIDVGWKIGSQGRLEGRMRQSVSSLSGSIMPETLQMFRDSIDAFHEVGLDSIKNSRAPEHILALLAVLEAGVTGSDKKDAGDFELQLFEGDRRFSRDNFLLITALPQPAMPDIQVKPVRKGYAGDEEVEMRLQVEYKRWNRSNVQIRNDNDYYPAGGWKKVNVNEVWDVDFGDDIRGGKVTVYCKSADTTISEVFYIRGINPSEQAVRDYLAVQGYGQWFLMKMIRQESGTLTAGADMRQLNPGTAYRAGWESAIGCPNMGDPRGFGLMQLDNWGTPVRYASSQQLWDWQANLDGGQEVLTEKLDIVNNQRAQHNVMITNWNRWNSDNPVSDSLQIEAGANRGTIVLSITEGTETFAVNPTGAQRDIYDASWIKKYNGGTFYHQIIRNSDDKPYRVIYRTNSVNRNYVEEVCNRND